MSDSYDPLVDDLIEAIELMTALISRGIDDTASLERPPFSEWSANMASRQPVASYRRLFDEPQPENSRRLCFGFVELCQKLLSDHEDCTGEEPLAILSRIGLKAARRELF